ncbi:hypothetical protein KIAC18_000293 [Sporomusa sphaeroides]|uniref:hypothetical protein n=1 Tax=Sporomusa sphaeroides TaxID=47679 RepID=UPI003DA04CDE
MLYWWPVAKHLSDFLAVLPAFSQWSVYPGTNGSAKKNWPCCEVQWDQEAGLSINNPMEGTITLWVDFWVRSDNVEPDDVYQQQHDAQMAVLCCLREWSDKLLKDLKIAAKVDCPGIASAGTITRPSFGCRMILTIEWRKSRERIQT